MARIRSHAIVCRRLLPVLLVAALSTLFILRVFRVHESSGVLRAKHGPTAEQIASGKNILPDLRDQRTQQQWDASPVSAVSPHPKGQIKPHGSQYTKCLVMAKMKNDRTDWIEDKLGDLLDNASLTTAVYTVNDRKAKLHPPKNKGHEVMVYLSYIIDHYDSLADVNIFMHGHRFAWHNNDVLDRDAAQMIRFLSAESVTREGYMNLRCHWDPGCPAWLFPENTKVNRAKQEEALLATNWPQLFPGDPIPEVLAQPCCAQFAVSRERIVMTSKLQYIHLRDWIIRTDLSDFLSGRIFEYVWQWIFNATPVYCPGQGACYCDAYGLCFGDEQAFEEWMDLMLSRNEYKEKLRLREEKMEEMGKDAKPEMPLVGEDAELTTKIANLEEEMEARKLKAFELGRNSKRKALKG